VQAVFAFLREAPDRCASQTRRIFGLADCLPASADSGWCSTFQAPPRVVPFSETR
jgi:hypothetical protein